MRKAVYILFVFVSTISSAQVGTWEVATKSEVISSYQKTWTWFTNTQNYAFKLKYTSYKDYVSKEIIESSEGYYKRLGNKYKTEVVGIKTIQNEKVRIIIDTLDKIITVLNPGKLNPALTNAKDLEVMLDNVKALKKRKIGKSVCYRIDFIKNELYEAYEFTINDKGLLESLVYYYSEQIEEDDGDGQYLAPLKTKVKPRLEVLFTNYQAPITIAESEFQEKLIVLNDKEKINLLDKYKAFQLKDYRYQAKK
ncbi:MAG: hypothetical protein HY062_01935 [Bacteroidetes bacterium]|nr:hypothetical protein [Bacteroidota bacterium]